MNSEHPWKIFIYILESPSATDLMYRRSEGELLCSTLSLMGIDSSHSIVIDRSRFELGLREHFFKTWIEKKGKSPILHISAHGNPDGLVLSNNEFVIWADLANLLRPLNKALNGYLIVSMSSCHGFSGFKMALSEAELPFYALIGNSASPTWSETAVAFTTFYHHLFRGTEPTKAIEAMRIASGNDKFVDIFGFQAKQGWLQFIKTPTEPPSA